MTHSSSTLGGIPDTETGIQEVQIDGEKFYKISNSDAMRPFFMSIVSDSDHWLFISSNGGLSAGRKNAEYSLFPYYTDDKITEFAEITGSKTVLQVQQYGTTKLWEPFSDKRSEQYNISRNLYKNRYGNKIIFEEQNHDLQLSFSYQWNTSDRFGFVKRSKLDNRGEAPLDIKVLDGIQNIVPYGVGSHLQNQSSNLVDAYKRNELLRESGLGIFALSAIIVDKAEPSEALRANVAWSLGLNDPLHLVSSLQIPQFRSGQTLVEETDIKAEKGAYFVQGEVELAAGKSKEWMMVAEIGKNHSAIAKLHHQLQQAGGLAKQVLEDIELGTRRLVALNTAADGLQQTADGFRDSRHFSNVLFNIMRGGIFDDNYQIEREDLVSYLAKANHIVPQACADSLQQLPEVFSLFQLKELVQQSDNADFKRLCLEYLPLKFSRRHGDPSRPWNKFSINTKSEVDGSKILDYQGNWRDIFQNWEALAHSYPAFIEGMIFRFLNATTADGYNPYRVTKDGFDWETIEPDDPWSYIGYWGDHQIIYLLKFLEFSENHTPGRLEEYFGQDLFVYANVPYKIKSYEDILSNPKDTIEFDAHQDDDIRDKRSRTGADGALLQYADGKIVRVNFLEKILASLLAKLSNFIPEAGIWMNTQRPEWNDANNALVGNGVSMVTLYYLRRYLKFFEGLLTNSSIAEVDLSDELAELFTSTNAVLKSHQAWLSGQFNDAQRKQLIDGLGQAASTYRQQIYEHSFSGQKQRLSIGQLTQFMTLALEYMEHSIRANRRSDHLYHAYNLMTVQSETEVEVSYLSEMLEGQVAVLSSGYLSAAEVLNVLDAMKDSPLFRPDQYSYLLYPNKELPRFMEKNNIPEAAVLASPLLRTLVEKQQLQIVEKDITGAHHFNGNFRNAADLKTALEALAQEEEYKALVAQEEDAILQLFEDVFNHKAFTGRSGTFFGYEGLGSIYWHMVSKLQLAVQECCWQAIEQGADAQTFGRLMDHYYEINAGIGVHKSPSLYGAFPTDPYSHTPAGKGAQQPGMTGQVKEDILSRLGELGVRVQNGSLQFFPRLLRKTEFLNSPQSFHYLDLQSDIQEIQLEEQSLCFTLCQVPIIYRMADQNELAVLDQHGQQTTSTNLALNPAKSRELFERRGSIRQVVVHIDKDLLLD
ncbi:MAG: hypothetical protein AAFV95_10855 [Bacteroidota bacterium]